MLTALDCETLTQPIIGTQSPAARVSAVSEEMKRILTKATAKDVSERYIDCVALEADLISLR
jgi:hypothetical protein